MRPWMLVSLISVSLLSIVLPANKLPQILAHRGASGSAPETTLAAYRLALDLGVDYLEIDVQMSRDGHIVGIHDSRVDRTSDGRGAVADMTFAELRKLDMGSWFNKAFPEKANPRFAGERIPTLQEIIDLARPTPVGLYIETKSPELYPVGFEAKVFEVVRRNQFEKRVVIQSFSRQSLEKVRALAPELPIALLIEKGDVDPVEATLAVGSKDLAIQFRLVTAELAARVHARGLALTVWTVDSEVDIKRMIDLGVDRIITNYPERLKRLLAR